jgi:activator of 2-hydroxyglutaryl-CoA dehydratase
MVAALRDKLGVTVNVPEEPQLTTALGAAVLGLQRRQRLGAMAAA